MPIFYAFLGGRHMNQSQIQNDKRISNDRHD